MRSAFLDVFLDALFPFGRRRPSLRSLLGGLKDQLMTLQSTIETLAADVKLNATVTAQTAAVTAANATAIVTLGETVKALAKDKGVDTTNADKALEGVAEQLAPLLASVVQTGGVLPGTPAAQANPGTASAEGAGASDASGSATNGGDSVPRATEARDQSDNADAGTDKPAAA